MKHYTGSVSRSDRPAPTSREEGEGQLGLITSLVSAAVGHYAEQKKVASVDRVSE